MSSVSCVSLNAAVFPPREMDMLTTQPQVLQYVPHLSRQACVSLPTFMIDLMYGNIQHSTISSLEPFHLLHPSDHSKVHCIPLTRVIKSSARSCHDIVCTAVFQYIDPRLSPWSHMKTGGQTRKDMAGPCGSYSTALHFVVQPFSASTHHP